MNYVLIIHYFGNKKKRVIMIKELLLVEMLLAFLLDVSLWTLPKLVFLYHVPFFEDKPSKCTKTAKNKDGMLLNNLNKASYC